MCVYFEQRCIDALDPEYNICKIAGSSLGVKYTQETKDKLSAMRIGNQNARGRAGKKYQPHSAETKAKISAALMGNKNSLGCIRTAETRKKLSKLLKGRKFTKAHLANMSLGQKRRRSACIGKTEDC